MIKLADRLGIGVHASLNGVKVMAKPGDDPLDLAAAWDYELRTNPRYPIAVACRGAELRARAAKASRTGGADDERYVRGR